MYKRVLTFIFSILLCSAVSSYAAGVNKKYTGPVLDGCSFYQLGMNEFVFTVTGKKLPPPQAQTEENSLLVLFDGARANNPAAINSSVSNTIEGIPILYNFEMENLSADQVSIQLDATMPLEVLTTSRTARGWSFRVKADETHTDSAKNLLDNFPVLVQKPSIPAPQTELPFTADTRTTIEFRDAELQDVFRLFMAALGRNIVIDSSFPKNTLVTMTLVDVRIDEIMNYLLRTYDIACYNYAPNITAFGTREALYKLSGAKELKTFKISYASPQRIGEILKNLLGFSVTLIRESAGEGSGSNTGVNTTSSTSTGSSISAREAQTGGRSSGSSGSSTNTVSEVMIDERFRMLYVKTNPARMEEVEEMIKMLDVPLRQVMIRASIFEFSDEATQDVQTTLNMVYDRWSLNSDLANGIGVISYEDRTYRNGRSNFDRYITASFSALEAKNKGKTIANPSVITIEGEEAKITLKHDITYSAGRDDSGNPTWQTTQVGPELTFTPIIEDKGYINLTIKINTGDYLGTDAQGHLQTTDRDIETHIRVRDGMPFVVGGLFQDISTKMKSKIPILGDIPLLGSFFSYTADNKSKTQAVMIVTPYIIDSR